MVYCIGFNVENLKVKNYKIEKHVFIKEKRIINVVV